MSREIDFEHGKLINSMVTSYAPHIKYRSLQTLLDKKLTYVYYDDHPHRGHLVEDGVALKYCITDTENPRIVRLILRHLTKTAKYKRHLDLIVIDLINERIDKINKRLYPSHCDLHYCAEDVRCCTEASHYEDVSDYLIKDKNIQTNFKILYTLLLYAHTGKIFDIKHVERNHDELDMMTQLVWYATNHSRSDQIKNINELLLFKLIPEISSVNSQAAMNILDNFIYNCGIHCDLDKISWGVKNGPKVFYIVLKHITRKIEVCKLLTYACTKRVDLLKYIDQLPKEELEYALLSINSLETMHMLLKHGANKSLIRKHIVNTLGCYINLDNFNEFMLTKIIIPFKLEWEAFESLITHSLINKCDKIFTEPPFQKSTITKELTDILLKKNPAKTIYLLQSDKYIYSLRYKRDILIDIHNVLTKHKYITDSNKYTFLSYDKKIREHIETYEKTLKTSKPCQQA